MQNIFASPVGCHGGDGETLFYRILWGRRWKREGWPRGEGFGLLFFYPFVPMLCVCVFFCLIFFLQLISTPLTLMVCSCRTTHDQTHTYTAAHKYESVGMLFQLFLVFFYPPPPSPLRSVGHIFPPFCRCPFHSSRGSICIRILLIQFPIADRFSRALSGRESCQLVLWVGENELFSYPSPLLGTRKIPFVLLPTRAGLVVG